MTRHWRQRNISTLATRVRRPAPKESFMPVSLMSAMTMPTMMLPLHVSRLALYRMRSLRC